MSAKFVAEADLQAWLSELAAEFAVYAPRLEDAPKPGAKPASSVVYRLYDPARPLELKRKATESAKHILFPRSESLFIWRNGKEGNTAKLELTTLEAPPKTLIFGLLSCDARGFLIFDPVYTGSGTEGRLQDPYYLNRRANSVLIVKSCSQILNTCFCHRVGGAPASTQGADVLATELPATADRLGGYLLSPVTERGEAVLSSTLLKEAGPELQSAAAAAQANAAALQLSMSPHTPLDKAPEALRALFTDMDFWQKEAAHCISCGACTYLCPTCYCFNITDETAGHGGVRLRNWDACMSSQFTLEASGHNPRNGKIQRMRNRVGHKFSYYPSLHQGNMACSGCGRCIKSCPSAVDIRRIVQDAVNAGKTNESTAKEAGNE